VSRPKRPLRPREVSPFPSEHQVGGELGAQSESVPVAPRSPHSRRVVIVIREATVEDVPRMVDCSRLTDRLEMSRFTRDIDEDELRFWISDPRAIVIVAVHELELLGYAVGFCVSPTWFFFDAFVVVPDMRKRGLGRKMYAHLRRKCQSRGIELIQGLVKDGHPETLNYWKKLGFEEGHKCIWVEDWLDER